MSNDKVEAIQAELAAKISALVDSEEWRRTLDIAARFHRYSPNNVMLIAMQCPEATRVAGFRKWQEFGRNVRKGEHAIRILAPARYKVTDDKTGEDKWQVRGFTTACVFDIGQTDGPDLEEVSPVLLTGDAEGLESIVALIHAQGFTFVRADCGRANGSTDFETRTVTVRTDLQEAQAVKTACHEFAHVLMHAPDTVDYARDRDRCEVEAESVAYIVCKDLGLPTDAYSLAYVAGWAGGSVELVKATAERVIRTASTILDALAPVAQEVAA